ncbi:hypothetical protein RM553_17850 [Zunongwangia sp. F363]|uniref:Outer membrane protein beta-barrel domain-containing protein n=1 Tax=Autumnicola tepida TaxID=3075595 RepID=A0ABU3CED2_9FLAO|nr:hypothetical protein [Zunongwangia sp. F363]MDT0644709.1 hypothetical protein [Zunongwangia sp. F363]
MKAPKNSKRNYFLLLILCIFSSSLNAQFLEKIYLEGEAVTKYSIGKESRRSIQYQDNITVNVPENSRFDAPVYGIGFSLNYRFNHSFSAGVGSGINFVKDQGHPYMANENYDKLMIPMIIKLNYDLDISENWKIVSELNGGIQLNEAAYGNSPQGFYFKEHGGMLAGVKAGIGRKVGKYAAVLKIGYEWNQLTNENSLGWYNYDGLTYNDIIEYKTNYHLLNVSLAVRL